MALREAMVSSKSNEWVTPQVLFEELDREFGFTLDPCSTDENCKCKKHYTIADDGLAQSWKNDIVFMNPPYGGNTGTWIAKALQESRDGATVVCLIVSATDRSYWHEHIFPHAAQIRFVRGRLRFSGVKSTAPFASAVVVFGRKKYKQRIVWYDESYSRSHRKHKA